MCLLLPKMCWITACANRSINSQCSTIQPVVDSAWSVSGSVCGATASEHCSCFTIVGRVWIRRTLLQRYTTLHAVMRLAQKSVFLWACMSGYSSSTVAIANNSGLLSHACTRNCLCYLLLLVSRSLSTLAVVSMYYFCFFEPTVSQALSTRERKIFFVLQVTECWKKPRNKALNLVHFVSM